MKLFSTPVPDGAGNCWRIAAEIGDTTLFAGCPTESAAAAFIGIQFGWSVQPSGPQNCVRPLPSARPVLGSKISPPPLIPALAYSLRSQNPVVFVAGLQVVRTVAVGIVNVPLTPLTCLVPW